MQLPDVPAFPSIELDRGRARLYRVHGPTCMLAVGVNIPGIIQGGALLAFSEHRVLAEKIFVAQTPEEVLQPMREYRGAADPLARDRLERPGPDDAPDVHELLGRAAQWFRQHGTPAA